MSYNVRYDNRNDHHDAWYARRDGIADLVRFHRPDVVGFQEPLPEQRADLRERLPEYAMIGSGRRDDDAGEGCPIGVRTDRWEITDHGTFWLSETPAEPSIGWDASHPRVATWVRVVPRTESAASPSPSSSPSSPSSSTSSTSQSQDHGRPFVLINTHLDHQGDRAREAGARLLRRRIPEILAGDEPVVLLGDFNCTADDAPHRVLTTPDGDRSGPALRDAAATADVRHGPTTSITDFSELIAGQRIDHVLVSQDVEVKGFATLADRDERGRYPSDHLPVLAQLDL